MKSREEKKVLREKLKKEKQTINDQKKLEKKRKRKARLNRVVNHSNNTFEFFQSKIAKSIRLQILGLFVLCVIFAIISFQISYYFLEPLDYTTEISYTSGIERIRDNGEMILNSLNEYELSLEDSMGVLDIMDSFSRVEYKSYITDLEGNVLISHQDGSVQKFDIHSVVKEATKIMSDDRAEEVTVFFPVEFNEGPAYMILKGIPFASEEGVRFSGTGRAISGLLSIITFVLVFTVLSNRKLSYLDHLAYGIHKISEGDLTYRVEEMGVDELGTLASKINQMSGKLDEKIKQERAIEETKNQLITNVSHDLRTPLTSIIGYLRLLKDKRYSSDEELEEFIKISYGKSEKMKVMIDDLFEYTKLTGTVENLSMTNVNFTDFIEQTIEEFLIDEPQVNVEKQLSDVNCLIDIDTEKMHRVMTNLLENAKKYGREDSSILVHTSCDEEHVFIELSNTVENPDMDVSKIFKRFYRGDQSRSDAVEGSGLGLAISKRTVEMHGGTIEADLIDNLFVIKIGLNKSKG